MAFGYNRLLGQLLFKLPWAKGDKKKALRLAKDGYVLIEFDIDTDGSVIDPYVVESEPAGLFERAAMKAIRKWLYEPPVYEGVSVKVNDVQVKLTFKVQ